MPEVQYKVDLPAFTGRNETVCGGWRESAGKVSGECWSGG